MKKTEAQANTLLNQYLREKKIYCYYELKIAKSLSFPFSKIEKNQHESLPALEQSGLVWKLSDEDSRQKPCDGFCTPPLPAYLVIKFGDKCYFIQYHFIEEMIKNGQKSINEDECIGFNSRVVRL